MEDLPHEGRIGTGAHLNPTPTEGPTIENSKTPEILLSNHYAPQAPETRGKVVIGGATEPEGTDTPLTEQADRTEEPLPEEKGTANRIMNRATYPSPSQLFFTLAGDGSRNSQAS